MGQSAKRHTSTKVLLYSFIGSDRGGYILETHEKKHAHLHREEYPHHANGEMMAPSNRGGWTGVGEQYRNILVGNLEEHEVSMNDYVLGSMAIEAYRCWIEYDGPGGQDEVEAVKQRRAPYHQPARCPACQRVIWGVWNKESTK